MMSTNNATYDDIKKCIENALISKESIVNISHINFEQNTEKGEGYMGDIVFVEATGTTSTNQEKQFNLVLKCSKPSEAFRKKLPVQQAFLREILMYDEIFPAFRRFQQSKAVKQVFDSVPKYYGKFTSNHQEIIILENLKTIGYELWDKKQPLTTEHLLMICREYGKFHAISVAMQDQDPKQFQTLLQKFENDIFKEFYKTSDMKTLIENNINFAHKELKNILDDKTLSKWLGLKEQLDLIFQQNREDENCLKVLSHGDCWNNNFMYKHDKNAKKLPIRSAIIDWQISFFISPILDLSYFLFTNMNKIAANNSNILLYEYYESFSHSLIEMGCDPNKLYHKDAFLKDWKKFGLFGLTMSPLLLKVGLVENSHVPDMAKSAENGLDISDTFNIQLNDTSVFKDRIAYLIKSAAESRLLD